MVGLRYICKHIGENVVAANRYDPYFRSSDHPHHKAATDVYVLTPGTWRAGLSSNYFSAS